jgi:hypothetical protein
LFTWQKWAIYGFPIVYLDWAVPIILVKAWRDERQVFRDGEVRFLGWLTLALFVLCVMPNVTTIRWPFRFLPVFHLFLILMVARIITVRRANGLVGLAWGWKSVAAAVVPPIVVGAALTVIYRPDFSGPLAPVKLIWVGIFTTLAVVLFALTKRWPPERRLFTLAAGHAITFLGIVLAYPTNPSLPQWQMPASRDAPSDNVFGAGNTLFLYAFPIRYEEDSSARFIHPEDRSRWLFMASSQLYLGEKAINGASALGPISVVQFFLFQDHGSLVRNPLPRVFSTDPKTGVSFADLMRIDSIVAEKGEWIAAAEATVPKTWERRILGGGEGMLFRRPPIEHPLPGTLTYLPDGVGAKLLSFSDAHEEYDIAVSPEYDGRPIVFARAWYPGYQIRLNGKAVDYELAGDILPELVLPAGFSGRLAIDYLPAGFLRGCLLAGFAAIGLLLVAVWQRRNTVPRPGLARLTAGRIPSSPRRLKRPAASP